MLRSLSVRDFVIVEKTDIDLESGFTVFSGETGAGKSIIIDALSLCLGGRAETNMIRENADKADISAIFDISPHIQSWLIAQDIDSESTLILRRTINRQGSSRAYINGTPATLSQLRELGDLLVDIHGQHAHQSLLKTDSQRELLDTQGQHLNLVDTVKHRYKTWQQLSQQLKQYEQNQQALQQEREQLLWQIEELQTLNPQEQEWETLHTEHSRLAHSQTLIEGVQQEIYQLSDADEAAHRQLTKASSHLQQLCQYDTQLEPLVQELESSRIAVQEALSSLNNYLNHLDLDPERFQEVDQRLQSYFSIARKFRVRPEELYAFQHQIQSRLNELNQEQDLKTLQEDCEHAQKDYQNEALKLRHARQCVAKILNQQVTQAMQTLAMEGGQFQVQLTDAPASHHGIDYVQFLVAGHAGTAPKPLNKIASGGELARISLALSVIASQAARVPTLIFDEVDTGVGGAVAEIVGKLLHTLGQEHQVLCVTHLAQVAACGDHHFLVKKVSQDQHTLSQLQHLSKEQRIDEIARMLGGLAITATTKAHAQEMLDL